MYTLSNEAGVSSERMELVDKLIQKHIHPEVKIQVIVDRPTFLDMFSSTLGDYDAISKVIRVLPMNIEMYYGRKLRSPYGKIVFKMHTFEEALESTIAHELHHAYQHQVEGTISNDPRRFYADLPKVERAAEIVGIEAVYFNRHEESLRAA